MTITYKFRVTFVEVETKTSLLTTIDPVTIKQCFMLLDPFFKISARDYELEWSPCCDVVSVKLKLPEYRSDEILIQMYDFLRSNRNYLRLPFQQVGEMNLYLIDMDNKSCLLNMIILPNAKILFPICSLEMRQIKAHLEMEIERHLPSAEKKWIEKGSGTTLMISGNSTLFSSGISRLLNYYNSINRMNEIICRSDYSLILLL